jgi:hypothetical protein
MLVAPILKYITFDPALEKISDKFIEVYRQRPSADLILDYRVSTANSSLSASSSGSSAI